MQAKGGLSERDAAQRWANRVSADADVGATWEYLLLSQNDIKTSKGSWSSLRRLGSG